MKKSLRLLFATLAAGALALCGCSSSQEHTTSSDNKKDDAKAPVTLTVFAAASLNKAFPDIVDKVLKKDHPHIDVNFSFEGSSTLVDQLNSGAPADVFASADEKNMTKATDAHLVSDVTLFAANVLTLIVPAGNRANITGLNDSLDGKKLVVCAPQVPCGNATKQLSEQLNVQLSPVSEEQKVTDVRAKVENGQADAGLVYVTDAKAAGNKVQIIDVDGSDKVVNMYPISMVNTSKHTKEAKAFIAAVKSPEGQKILEKYGFRSPTAGS
ncbi:MAG: molybdate ABC transporter substrate-binding protein [Actinomycetaceae bacterium]|nr:molybdate ABC transporter substrate-binding protein [Actinomycetaceae bacterium]